MIKERDCAVVNLWHNPFFDFNPCNPPINVSLATQKVL